LGIVKNILLFDFLGPLVQVGDHKFRKTKTAGFKLNQIIEKVFLDLLRAAPIDAHQRGLTGFAGMSCEQAGMGRGASAGADHTVAADSFIEGLPATFLGAGNIAPGPYLNGGAPEKM
jgi:hypothetical protein